MFIIRCKFENKTNKKRQFRPNMSVWSTRSCYLACSIPQPVLRLY